MDQQLTLDIQFHDDASLGNFYGAGNQEIIHLLNNQQERLIYLWGGEGSGRTHLLQACCARAAKDNASAVYLPLSSDLRHEANVLEGCSGLSLICLDDIEHVIGDRQWEEGLFNLYNAIREGEGRLIITAQSAPAQLDIGLADLKSRLSACLVMRIHPLTDEEKVKALKSRAKNRGIEFSDDVAHYLLTHYSRDQKKLFTLLDQLDELSLAKQRKLTIPFVKDVIAA